jgi:hypothetical protein
LLSEIGINLAVPCKVFALANELSQLCQIAGRKRFYRLLNFGKAHLLHFNRKRNCSQEQERQNRVRARASAFAQGFGVTNEQEQELEMIGG